MCLKFLLEVSISPSVLQHSPTPRVGIIISSILSGLPQGLAPSHVMAQNSQGQDWKTRLCDTGDDGDCPRSCCIGCDQLGRTRYRLDRVDLHEDGLDLTHYKECNGPCWIYFCLCVGTLCMYTRFSLLAGLLKIALD